MLLLIAADLRRRVETMGASSPRLAIVDAGCGRSYLSLLVAWWARGALGAEARVLGIDRSSKALASCARRAAAAGLGEVMRFVPGELSSVAVDDVWAEAFGAPRTEPLDALLALHACDTATCDAIVLGVRHEAALIAVAPCCQAELARAWAALDARAPGHGLRAVHAHPHLRREVGAHVTDALRAALLGAAGYRATPMELVGSEHTPKNTLVRAVLDPSVDRTVAWSDHDALVRATGGARLALADRIEALRPRA
jgi:predicted RNA methylase